MHAGYEEALLPVDYDAVVRDDDCNLLLTTHVKEVSLHLYVHRIVHK